MSELNINSNLFIERQELGRLQKFLGTDGFRLMIKKMFTQFGILRDDRRTFDPDFKNFKVELGSTANTIKISGEPISNSSYGITSDGEMIILPSIDNISINPNIPADGILDNTWYWLKARRLLQHNFEEGSLSINTSGQLTGTGTTWLDTLRGSTNFPVKVSFLKRDFSTLLNTGEYEVRLVVSDNSAYLSGVNTTFLAESNLKLRVIGAFSPTYIPSSSEKYIYEYDYCDLTTLKELVTDTEPLALNGTEFYIARFKNDVGAGLITIEDKRKQFARVKGEEDFEELALSSGGTYDSYGGIWITLQANSDINTTLIKSAKNILISGYVFLSEDAYIILKTDGAKKGDKFHIRLKGHWQVGTPFAIKFVEDTSSGSIFYQINDGIMLAYTQYPSISTEFNIHFIFDGTTWKPYSDLGLINEELIITALQVPTSPVWIDFQEAGVLTGIAFNSGWSSNNAYGLGYNRLRYRLTDFGKYLEIEGYAENVGGQANINICNMTAAYRPPRNIKFIVGIYNGSSDWVYIESLLSNGNLCSTVAPEKVHFNVRISLV